MRRHRPKASSSSGTGPKPGQRGDHRGQLAMHQPVYRWLLRPMATMSDVPGSGESPRRNGGCGPLRLSLPGQHGRGGDRQAHGPDHDPRCQRRPAEAADPVGRCRGQRKAVRVEPEHLIDVGGRSQQPESGSRSPGSWPGTAA